MRERREDRADGRLAGDRSTRSRPSWAPTTRPSATIAGRIAEIRRRSVQPAYETSIIYVTAPDMVNLKIARGRLSSPSNRHVYERKHEAVWRPRTSLKKAFIAHSRGMPMAARERPAPAVRGPRSAGPEVQSGWCWAARESESIMSKVAPLFSLGYAEREADGPRSPRRIISPRRAAGWVASLRVIRGR